MAVDARNTKHQLAASSRVTFAEDDDDCNDDDVDDLLYIKRGDAPAQAVLHANQQAKALRQASETQEKLRNIQGRVQETLDSYDLSEAAVRNLGDAVVQKIKDNFTNRGEASLELVDDLSQLMIILADPIAKKKYQQHVTVFIVGYESLCGNRAKLLHQINEFFAKIAREAEDYDSDDEKEKEIADMGNRIKGTLENAERMHSRLTSVSKEMLELLESSSAKDGKSRRRKLEKALHQSKEDVISLTEKLMSLQTDFNTNEDKLAQLQKTSDNRLMEAERLKAQVQLNKRKIVETDLLQKNLNEKEEIVVTSRQEIDRLRLLVSAHEDKEGNIIAKSRQSREAHEIMGDQHEEKIVELQNNLIEMRQVLEQQYENQLKNMRDSYQTEVTELKERFTNQLDDAKDKMAELMKEKEVLEEDKMSALTRAASYMTSLSDTDTKRSSTKSSWKSSARAARTVMSSKERSQVGTASSIREAEPESPWPTKALGKDDSLLSFPSRYSSAVPRSAPNGGAERRTVTSIDNDAVTVEVKEQFHSDAVISAPTTSTTTVSCQTEIETPKPLTERKDASMQTEKSESRHTSPVIKMNSPTPTGTMHPPQIRDAEQDGECAALNSEHTHGRGDATTSVGGIHKGKQQTKAEIAPESRELASDAQENKDTPLESKIVADEAASVNAALEMDELKSKMLKLQMQYDNKVNALRDVLVVKDSWDIEKEVLLGQIQSANQQREQAEKDAEASLIALEEMYSSHAAEQVIIDATENVSHNVTDTGTQFDSGVDVRVPSARHSGSALQSHRAMSSRTRHRVINSALRDEGILQHVMSCYATIATLKSNVMQLLKNECTEQSYSYLKDIHEISLFEDGACSFAEQVSLVNNYCKRVAGGIEQSVQDVVFSEDMFNNRNAIFRNTSEAIITLDSVAPTPMSSGCPPDKQTQTTRPPTIVVNDVAIQMSEKKAAYHHAMQQCPSASDKGTPQTKKDTVKGRQRLIADYKALIKRHATLEEQLCDLQQTLESTSNHHEDQLLQNARLIEEMQATIHDLQRTLGVTRQGGGRPATMYSSTTQMTPLTPSFMFSRRDMERNAKSLERSVDHGSFAMESYKLVHDQMEEYISLPIKRLAALVVRYRHHVTMKEIENKLTGQRTLDASVVSLLEKMELLQRGRAQKWLWKMAKLSDERLHLAKILMNTLELTERETGSFMIKPMLYTKPRAGFSYSAYMRSQSSLSSRSPLHCPAPTPIGPVVRSRVMPGSDDTSKSSQHASEPLTVMHLHRMTQRYKDRSWDVGQSYDFSSLGPGDCHIGIPHLLEMDINKHGHHLHRLPPINTAPSSRGDISVPSVT